MPADQVARLPLTIATREGDEADPAALEELALDLRTTLADAGAARVDRRSGGPAPDGTRSVELLAVLTFVVTAVQTAESLTKVVRAVQLCLRRLQAGRQVEADLGDGLVVTADAPIEPIVTALLTRPATARTGVRSALVVANGRYSDPALAGLRGPTQDADALARILGDPAIGDFDVDLLMDADETAVRRRVAAFFANRDRDDVLLLYFSCHGVKDQRGQLYFAASDTEFSSLSATAVAASFVNDQMAQTQSQRVVLMLDCCYSGAFSRTTGAARSDRSVHIGDTFSAGTGRIVLTASSATEYAFEGGDLAEEYAQTSVFTTALVAGLESGDADLGGDGEISVDELYDYTYRHVRRRNPDQTPMKWTFGVEGSLTIARSVKPAELPDGILADLSSDRVALRLEAVAALGRLAAGRPSALRDRAVAELRRLQADDDSARVRAAAGELAPATPAAVATAAPAPVTAPVSVETSATVPVPPQRGPERSPSDRVPSPAAESHRSETVAHPLLLVLISAVTAVSLIQLVQILTAPRGASAVAGLNVIAVVPVASAIAAVTMLRARQSRWALGLAILTVVTILQWITGLADIGMYPTAGQILRAFLFYYPSSEAVGDFLQRFVVAVPVLFWYALFGPLAVPWSRRRQRIGLLATAIGGVLVLLTGAFGLHVDTDSAAFSLFTPAQMDNIGVGGFGNIYDSSHDFGFSLGSLLWTIGWLVVVTTAVYTLVATLSRRRWRWAATVGVPMLIALVLGSQSGLGSSSDVERLAQELAVTGILMALGPIAYALFGQPRTGGPSHDT